MCAAMDAHLLDPFRHARPMHLCPSCGAPDDLTGISCFCEPAADGVPPCETCGAAFGEYEASCPQCRRSGRVDCGLERFLDPLYIEPLRTPVTAFTAEEPLAPIAFARSRQEMLCRAS